LRSTTKDVSGSNIVSTNFLQVCTIFFVSVREIQKVYQKKELHFRDALPILQKSMWYCGTHLILNEESPRKLFLLSSSLSKKKFEHRFSVRPIRAIAIQLEKGKKKNQNWKLICDFLEIKDMWNYTVWAGLWYFMIDEW